MCKSTHTHTLSLSFSDVTVQAGVHCTGVLCRFVQVGILALRTASDGADGSRQRLDGGSVVKLLLQWEPHAKMCNENVAYELSLLKDIYQ